MTLDPCLSDFVRRDRWIAPMLVMLAILLCSSAPASAGCPPGESNPITSRGGAGESSIVFSNLGGGTRAAFFLLEHGDGNNSGSLPSSAWLIDLGDLDGDGLPEFGVDAPGEGPGGWGDPRTEGCPTATEPSRPPLVLLISQEWTDFDLDGLFDVFEDFQGNGVLSQDLDGDGRLTPPGGCEGVLREDQDCDGHLDFLDEDFNGNGLLDPGEDIDGDGRLDPFVDTDGDGFSNHEDRNRNQLLDDRPFVSRDDLFFDENGNLDPFYPYGAIRPARGGVVVASVAWNGAAYDLSTITTPTRSLDLDEDAGGFGTMLRVVDATRLSDIATGTSGHREKADGTWRARIEIPGLDLQDEVGGQRGVFDGETLRLVTDRGMAPRFVESGEPVLLLPATGNGAAATFASLVSEVFNIDVPDVEFDTHPRSSGSDRFLQRSGVLAPLTSCRIVEKPFVPYETGACNPFDRDGDDIANHLDHCPDVPDRLFINFDKDTDRDGIGTLCDPDDPPGSTVPDVWVDVSSGVGPGSRKGAAAVYDPSRRVTVLFGGAADTATWEFAAGSWSRIETSDAPAARRDHRLAYDARRRRVLLFGGQRLADGEILNDSWSYDGNRWIEIRTRTKPAPRTAAGMTYDVENDRIVLFGGRDDTRILGDTWFLDGTTWRRAVSPRFPEARYGHQMAYDPIRRLTVLQGGVTLPGAERQPNGTWEFDGAVWQPVDHRGEIPPTWNGVMTFDTGRRQVVTFGGRVIFQDLVSDLGTVREQTTAATRLYDGIAWKALPTANTAAPRVGHAAAFDAGRNVLIVHGGESGGVSIDITEELHRPIDVDGDEIRDGDDNCPLISNIDQNDSDGDGNGDACDNCPDVSNPAQRDLDRDLRGDACDADSDGDGVPNNEDVCPLAFVDGRSFNSVLEGGGPDSDGDGMANDCDICPGDPANDVDRDGVCGDRDNCPAAFNSLQDDSNADGGGDACQPFLDILSVEPINRNTLRARVGFDNPDGDPLQGAVRIHPTATLVDVVPRLGEACELAFLPDGVAGEGIAYGRAFGSAPAIADVDAALGCDDGIADFEMRMGRCSDFGGTAGFDTSLALSGEIPFTICVRRRAGGGAAIDYDVLRIGADDLLLGLIDSVTVEAPIAGTRLPGQVDLEALEGPGIYLLAIEVTDDTTPVVAAREPFVHEGEKRLSIQTIRGGDNR